MRLQTRPVVQPKYWLSSDSYPATFSNPKTTSASLPVRSGARISVIVAPRLITFTVTLFPTSVNDSTGTPSAVAPKGWGPDTSAPPAPVAPIATVLIMTNEAPQLANKKEN